MQKRGKGLSGHEQLGRKECMLFIFGYNARHALWMRGMKFPIDVLWLNEKKKIVDIKENLKPAKMFEFKTYSPDKDAMYVIELPAGFVKSNKIRASTTIKF